MRFLIGLASAELQQDNRLKSWRIHYNFCIYSKSDKMIQNEVWIILEQGEPLKGQALLRVYGRIAMVFFLAVSS